jgi:two-component system, OmpR family, KDP operon response regulator KdpE
MTTPIRLLVVDDDVGIRRILRNSLGSIGFAIDDAADGETGLSKLQRNPCDLVLLDINIPGMGGFETCRRMRHLTPETGIVIISVRGREEDKVQALEVGADDYVTKPFCFRELVARLRSVYRRTRGPESPDSEILRTGTLELNLRDRVLRKSSVEVHLSQKEFDILAFLMRHPNAPIPHARLLQAVWGPEYGGELEYLRTYIRHLRMKIEQDPAHPVYLLTEPWFGYRFRNGADLDASLPAADGERQISESPLCRGPATPTA